MWVNCVCIREKLDVIEFFILELNLLMLTMTLCLRIKTMIFYWGKFCWLTISLYFLRKYFYIAFHVLAFQPEMLNDDISLCLLFWWHMILKFTYWLLGGISNFRKVWVKDCSFKPSNGDHVYIAPYSSLITHKKHGLYSYFLLKLNFISSSF